MVFWLSLALSEFTVIYWIGLYLTNRKQRVKIDDVSSDWCKIEAGVPQSSVLGSLFLIYFNDLLSSVGSSCFLFANDCFLLNLVHSPVSCSNALNDDLAFISSWTNQWLVTLNASKTKSMIFSTKQARETRPPVYVSRPRSSWCYIKFSSNLSWRLHILKIHQKAPRKLNLLKPLKCKLSRFALDVLYKALVRSSL